MTDSPTSPTSPTSPGNRRLILILGLVAFAILVAWLATSQSDDGGAETDAPPKFNDPIACTEIGCTSGLMLDATSVLGKDASAKRIKVCVKGRCRGFAASNSLADFRLGGLEEGETVRVRMVVYAKGGKVLYRSSVKAEVDKSQPNGPKCPPTCFQVRAEISDQTGKLVRT